MVVVVVVVVALVVVVVVCVGWGGSFVAVARSAEVWFLIRLINPLKRRARLV